MSEHFRFSPREPSPHGCRRATGRRLQERLISNLGPVLDLSAGGMRVLASRRPSRKTSNFTLFTADGPVRLRGRVAWTKRTGAWRVEFGVEFTDVSEALRSRLTRIASAHRVAHRLAG